GWPWSAALRPARHKARRERRHERLRRRHGSQTDVARATTPAARWWPRKPPPWLMAIEGDDRNGHGGGAMSHHARRGGSSGRGDKKRRVQACKARWPPPDTTREQTGTRKSLPWHGLHGMARWRRRPASHKKNRRPRAQQPIDGPPAGMSSAAAHKSPIYLTFRHRRLGLSRATAAPTDGRTLFEFASSTQASPVLLQQLQRNTPHRCWRLLYLCFSAAPS